jgi:hypothetical protein
MDNAAMLVYICLYTRYAGLILALPASVLAIRASSVRSFVRSWLQAIFSFTQRAWIAASIIGYRCPFGDSGDSE